VNLVPMILETEASQLLVSCNKFLISRMEAKVIIDQLELNATAFSALLGVKDQALIDWRPAADKWNLREIAAHLYDEEREDFRARVLHYLYRPNETMKSIDPEEWVSDRKYNEMDYELVVKDLLAERAESISLLRGIDEILWAAEYEHNKWGKIGPRFFLNNWLAHDYLHFKQISQHKYLFLKAHSTFPIDYAG